MEFRKIGLIWNPTKTSGFEVARELREILAERGLSVTTGITLAHALGAPELAEGSFDECDLLMVLGGDGTLLSALDYALPKNIPMLGINLGRMGFMTEVDPANLRRDVSEVLNGNYTIDSRMTLTVAGQNENNFFALNDIVLTRSTPSVRILSLEIEVNGIVVDRISGDGLIVATATGSTAYSLSAGGPIIRPGLDCLVITPICPHTLNTRPVVVSSNDVIKIRVMDDRGGAQAVMDGRKIINVPCGEPGVTILRSELRARFIRLHDRNYFSLLRDKLSEWTH